jgi:hypothetical protein
MSNGRAEQREVPEGKECYRSATLFTINPTGSELAVTGRNRYICIMPQHVIIELSVLAADEGSFSR